MTRPSFPPLPPPESIAIGVPSSHPGEPWSHLAGEKGRREETLSKSTPFSPALSFLNVPIPRASLRCHLPVPPPSPIYRTGGVEELPLFQYDDHHRGGDTGLPLLLLHESVDTTAQKLLFFSSPPENKLCVYVYKPGLSLFFYLYPFFSCSIFQPAKQACALPPKTRTKWRRP